MWGMIAGVVGGIINKVCGIIDQVVVDKDLANKLKTEIQLAMLNRQFDFAEKELEAQTRVILAELQGNQFQRGWRPTLMYSAILIMVNNYIFLPYAHLLWPNVPVLEFPGGLWALMSTSVGGYIGARTLEKIKGAKDIQASIDVLKKGAPF